LILLSSLPYLCMFLFLIVYIKRIVKNKLRKDCISKFVSVFYK